MTNLKNAFEYLLIFLLVAVSGFPFFYYNVEYLIIGSVLAIIYFFIKKKNEKIDLYFVSMLLFLTIWETLQLLYFDAFSIRTVAGTVFRLTFAYFTIRSLSENFFNKYVRLTKFFATISLFFYALFYLPEVTNTLRMMSLFIRPFFSIENATYSYSPNLIIFNFSGYNLDPPRNSGPFWEPGAFAAFLIIAIVLNIFNDKKVRWSNNIIFLVSLLTTFSTAGYITFFIVIILIYSISKIEVQANFQRVIYLILFLFVFQYLYENLEFMGKKIDASISASEETTSSRFGSALADYELYIKNPILGYSRSIVATYGIERWDLKTMHRNNGLTKLFVTWGIVGFLILYRIWVSCRSVAFNYYIGNGALILFSAILASSFSQGLFQFPFFLGIIFWNNAVNVRKDNFIK